ncbi:potassium/proton antiporter [Neptunicella sp. SCSIO 80796]|uniref:potassium/proton antiporter n=1 Tax=Neptunicella plasticusilytica TaxID=3117012 RepID=UPI003A4DF9EB
MGIEFTNQLIFVGAILALLCVFASVVSRRLGAPLLLVFLVMGMLAGEDGPGGIKFNDFSLAFLFGSLALAIIIFDGGLGARRSTFRVSLKPALSLATLGVLITAGITGFAAHWLLDFTWQEGLLIGAIVGSTDAAAVFGLLKGAGVELKERAGAALEIESGTNDPMAILLTVTMVELLVNSETLSGWLITVEFVQQIGFGVILGFACGHILTLLLKHLSLPSSLYSLMALAGALSIFGVTNMLGGSGFLAIYIVGAIIGNTALPYSNDIHRFHDGIAWLSQIGMFLMLGLLITPSHLTPIILPALAISFILIFIARPIAILLSLLPFRFPWREQLFMSWCGLRGAVPIILALYPSLAGLEHTETYFELVFFIVLVSLVLQGWSIAPMARWLDVELPPPAREAKHLSLFIPDDQKKELLIYHVIDNVSAIGTSTDDLPLEEGAQFVGVLRNGVLLERHKPQLLKAQDRVLIIVSYGQQSNLGRLFAPSKPHFLNESSAFFGEFIIRTNTKLTDLAALYDFDLSEQQKNMTIAELLNVKFHGKPVIGDRIKLGWVCFVVRGVQQGQITEVGLKLS